MPDSEDDAIDGESPPSAVEMVAIRDRVQLHGPPLTTCSSEFDRPLAASSQEVLEIGSINRPADERARVTAESRLREPDEVAGIVRKADIFPAGTFKR